MAITVDRAPEVTDTQIEAGDIIACYDCDLLLRNKRPRANNKVCCPRCGAVFSIARNHSQIRTLAISITGLILFIPANPLPLLSFEFLGQSSSNTMMNGLQLLTSSGYWWMSVLVLFCSVLAPLIKLFLLVIISLGSLLRRWRRQVIKSMVIYHTLNEWGMFDVYLLGIMVSYIKMLDVGTIIIDAGLFCFVSLMLTATLCSLSYDPQSTWQTIENDW